MRRESKKRRKSCWKLKKGEQLDIAKKRLEDQYEELVDPDNLSYGAGMH